MFSKEHVTFPCHLWRRNNTMQFRTGRLEQELQMVQLSASRCSCNYSV